jgi:bifunctional oligoribonuclease and PAP phosphatase NrnA
MEMKGLKESSEKIKSVENIVIACHINPDGDAIGSLVSLGLGLKQMGKEVDMLSPDGVPEMYRGLPGTENIKERTSRIPELAIAVDSGNKKLLGKSIGTFEKAKWILSIDHHEVREPYGNLQIVEPDSSSVGELIYLLLKKLDVDITRDIALNILTSIIVETNSFRLPNIRPSAFEICARLLETGIDFYSLSEMVYWSKTKEAALLLGICLSRCKYLKKGKIVWSELKHEDLLNTGGKKEDADIVVGEMLSVKDVNIAIFFREEGDVIRVSLRSKGSVNVAEIARKYDGGGHYDSAGCFIPKSDEFINKILRDAEELFLKENFYNDEAVK